MFLTVPIVAQRVVLDAETPTTSWTRLPPFAFRVHPEIPDFLFGRGVLWMFSLRELGKVAICTDAAHAARF